MKKIFGLVVMMVLGTFIYGCGERVEVPPAHVGKILTKDGFRTDLIPPSKFRLDPCVFYCDKIILLSEADEAITENMVLFMPKDKLEMSFDVKLTLAISQEKMGEIFAKSPQEYEDNRVSYINRKLVYNSCVNDYLSFTLLPG